MLYCMDGVERTSALSWKTSIILTIKTLLICIYIYICNELIEETASHRKLIFGIFWLWLQVFWLWLQEVLSSEQNVDSSWNYDVIVTF